jgi:hypothetical protein
MQAVTGFEQAVGGAGNEPVAATWIPIDISGGWVAAAGMLAGLYARVAGGQGQRVVTSLLGAGVLLQSGVFQRDGELVRGPGLDPQQTGYGPGYRIYEGSDGNWFALVLPDDAAWLRLASLPEAASLPRTYAPLRTGAADANGNVEGGVRTPAVDVPVATLSGLGQSGSSFCFLFGTTVPFSAAKLAALYPTHRRFVVCWAADTIADARAGFIRPADAAELIAAAAKSSIGG